MSSEGNKTGNSLLLVEDHRLLLLTCQANAGVEHDSITVTNLNVNGQFMCFGNLSRRLTLFTAASLVVTFLNMEPSVVADVPAVILVHQFLYSTRFLRTFCQPLYSINMVGHTLLPHRPHL